MELMLEVYLQNFSVYGGMKYLIKNIIYLHLIQKVIYIGIVIAYSLLNLVLVENKLPIMFWKILMG